MTRHSYLAALFFVGGVLSAGAAGAQGQSPFPVASPGQWAFVPEFDVVSLPFHGLTYGQVRAAGPGSAIVANIINDDAPRAVVGVPAFSVARGLNGFGGMPVEIYGRLAATSGGINSTSVFPLTGAQNGIIPLVSRGQINEGAYLLGTGSPITVTQNRQLASTDASAGVRTQFMLGSVAVIPGLQFAYQRLDANDNVSFTGANGPYSSTVRIATDYYQFAASLTALVPLAPQWYLSGTARTSFDLASANLTATSAFFAFGGPLDSATATDSKSFNSNHSIIEAGVVFAPSSGWSFSVMGNAEYISAVPGAVFPIYSSADLVTAPLNGITSTQIGDFESAMSYGVRVAAALKF